MPRPRLLAVSDHGENFGRLFKMIKSMGFYPPSRRFHQNIGLIVLVLEKGIKGHPDILAFLRDLFFAHIDYRTL